MLLNLLGGFFMGKADIGLIGIAVMGEKLVMTWRVRFYSSCVYRLPKK